MLQMPKLIKEWKRVGGSLAKNLRVYAMLTVF